MPSLLPSLYINITERCNMQCEYCPAYGENWESTDGLMPVPELVRAVRIASEAGIASFRISGGEPMIFPDRVFSILETLARLGRRDVILNSNGFNLHKHVARLQSYAVRKVKISLDAVDRAEFKRITNSDKLGDVMQSIAAIKDANIGLELNLVLLRSCVDNFWAVLEFCVAEGVSLKVLDLVRYDTFVRNNLSPEAYFAKEYYSPALLEPALRRRFGEPKIARLSNDRGIPMAEYGIGSGATVTLKDGGRGTTFAKACVGCHQFPCQEGLFHLSLSAEGNLTPCRLRRDLTKALAGKSETEVRGIIGEALGAYCDAVFVRETVEFPGV